MIVAVLLLFAIPVSAYHIAGEYWGFASGVRIAIENKEGIKIDQKLRYEDWSITIDNAVWEENDLAITYSVEGTSFSLGLLQVVDDNNNEIDQGYVVNGYAVSDGEGEGTVNFKNIDLGQVQGERVWLRILTLIKNESPPPVAAITQVRVTPVMKTGEFVDINKELEVDKGTYLLKNIYFGKGNTRVYFDFMPREKYRELYSPDSASMFLPRMRLTAGGKNYSYSGASKSFRDGMVQGTFDFDALPIEEIDHFQIDVVDNFALVDWKVPIPIQTKGSERLELAEEIRLPEGKLILTGMRHGTKSTAIDFTFEPAMGFEGIASIWFDAYLRRNDKYYHRHGFERDAYNPGLSGTIAFDPVRYDSIDEVEFILGEIQYSYSAGALVTVSPTTIPQTIEALGSTFIIDHMEHQDGQTLLHITYDQENRWFHNAAFDIRVPTASSIKVRSETEMGFVELQGIEELKVGLQRLKDKVGDYDLELKEIDLEQRPSGQNISISGEREEVEVKLSSLSAIRYSGESVKIPVK